MQAWLPCRDLSHIWLHHWPSEASATGTPSATEATVISPKFRTAKIGSATVTGPAHLFTSFFTSEEIEPVDGMEHSIAVNAVVLGVGTLYGIDRATEVALPVQDVEQLQAQR